MKLRNLFFAAAALTACGTAAAAEHPWYVGAAATEFTADANTLPAYKANGPMVKLGFDLTRNFAVELHYGQSSEVSKNFANGTRSKFTVRQMGAAFLRGNLNFDSDKVRVYAVVGYAGAKVRLKTAATSDDDTVSSPAYGLGIELYGTDRTALYAETMRYINNKKFNFSNLNIKEKGDLSTLGVGLVYHF